jgi:hypothetical protein
MTETRLIKALQPKKGKIFLQINGKEMKEKIAC